MDLGNRWEALDDLRAQVAVWAATWGPEIADAASMVASELAENAIKYGDDKPASFRLHAGVSDIAIEVCSGLASEAAYDKLREHIERIDMAPDKMALYNLRLQEIYRRPPVSAGLGLYRIAAEGGFTLTCTWKDNMLRIQATRSLVKNS